MDATGFGFSMPGGEADLGVRDGCAAAEDGASAMAIKRSCGSLRLTWLSVGRCSGQGRLRVERYMGDVEEWWVAGR